LVLSLSQIRKFGAVVIQLISDVEEKLCHCPGQYLLSRNALFPFRFRRLSPAHTAPRPAIYHLLKSPAFATPI
jgi:hypothetical protein